MSAEIVVSIRDGKIRGLRQNSPFFVQEFFSFYGIPYAVPPIENLRFKDPIKIKPWKSIRDATTEKYGFCQFSQYYFKYMGTEDSLYVNVHTPKLPSSNEPLKAVIVLIHGGGLTWGSPDSSHHGSPYFVMNRDIVYVTIGYRLNIFGFLNLEMKDCSGNQGMKDIVMALKWIRDNIQSFNGDPKNVTILGSSSGAFLVHVLMLSPAAKGLFHKAIMMGNYVFNCLSVSRNDQKKMTFDYAKFLGFEGKTTKQLLFFLKSLPAVTIIETIKTFTDKMKKDVLKATYQTPFRITIDHGKDAILPKSARELISSMEHVPLIFGICEREMSSAFTCSTIESTKKYFKNSIRQSSIGWIYSLDDKEFNEIHQEIESFYFENFHNDTPLSIKEKILSDAAFSDIYDTLINPISDQSPSSAYVYQFQYDGEMNASKTYQKYMVEKFSGSYHFDDFCYWGCVKAYGTPTPPECMKIVYIITKLFTNFAKTGNPNFKNMEVEWKPSTPTEPSYLSINEKLIMIDEKLNGNRFEFWDNLMKRFKPK